MAEPVTKRRHCALEARISGVFKDFPSLADNAVQESVRMVPGVPIAIQWWRWQEAVVLPDMPVLLSLTANSVTGSAIRGECLATCWSSLRTVGTVPPVAMSSLGKDEHAVSRTDASSIVATAAAQPTTLTPMGRTYRTLGKVSSC